jgi:hypothetical protein
VLQVLYRVCHSCRTASEWLVAQAAERFWCGICACVPMLLSSCKRITHSLCVHCVVSTREQRRKCQRYTLLVVRCCIDVLTIDHCIGITRPSHRRPQQQQQQRQQHDQVLQVMTRINPILCVQQCRTLFHKCSHRYNPDPNQSPQRQRQQVAIKQRLPSHHQCYHHQQQQQHRAHQSK